MKRTSKSALYDGEIGDVAQEIGCAGSIWISALCSIGLGVMSVGAIDAIDLGGRAVCCDWNHLAFVRRRERVWDLVGATLGRHFVVMNEER